jgi:Domain of unknown function (DUF1841)
MANNRGKQRRAAKQKKRREARQRDRAAQRGSAPTGPAVAEASSETDWRERCGYDANQAPAAAEWLALDESERMKRVESYHRHALAPDKLPPSMPRHVGLHVSTENQLAADQPPQVGQALGRLMREGMSRHDAVHAVGSVMMAHLKRALDERAPVDNQAYMQELEQLTLKRWLEGLGVSR